MFNYLQIFYIVSSKYKQITTVRNCQIYYEMFKLPDYESTCQYKLIEKGSYCYLDDEHDLSDAAVAERLSFRY